MKTVKIKAYAKINLTLDITGVENGYHMLDSLVASVDVFDLIVLKERKDGLSTVTMKGMGSEGIPPEQNNAWKAAEAFSKEFHTNGADITVYKNIPMGAGLGGSSADVSGVLNGMAKLYKITDFEKLKELADGLGSDTGYMLTGGFARMQGRGEKVTPLSISQKLYFLFICPTSSVSSGACYRAYDEQVLGKVLPQPQTGNCIEKLSKGALNEVGRYLTNDLYLPATTLNEDVKTAYEQALQFSPLGAVMTGSGSCVVALFETKELCEWAKSRYRGKFHAFVGATVVPDYQKKKKLAWKNPFALSEDELED